MEFQCDINKISQWTSANHMTFNTNKCKRMMLSKKRHPPTPSLYLNSQQLELVKCYKYLGVCIESDLKLEYSYHRDLQNCQENNWANLSNIFPTHRPSSNGQTRYPADKTSSGVWCTHLAPIPLLPYLCPGKSTKVCSKDVFRGMDLQLRGST